MITCLSLSLCGAPSPRFTRRGHEAPSRKHRKTNITEHFETEKVNNYRFYFISEESLIIMGGKNCWQSQRFTLSKARLFIILRNDWQNNLALWARVCFRRRCLQNLHPSACIFGRRLSHMVLWRWVWPCDPSHKCTSAGHFYLLQHRHTGQAWYLIRVCREGHLRQSQAMLSSRCAQYPPELLV